MSSNHELGKGDADPTNNSGAEWQNMEKQETVDTKELKEFWMNNPELMKKLGHETFGTFKKISMEDFLKIKESVEEDAEQEELEKKRQRQAIVDYVKNLNKNKAEVDDGGEDSEPEPVVESEEDDNEDAEPEPVVESEEDDDGGVEPEDEDGDDESEDDEEVKTEGDDEKVESGTVAEDEEDKEDGETEDRLSFIKEYQDVLEELGYSRPGFIKKLSKEDFDEVQRKVFRFKLYDVHSEEFSKLGYKSFDETNSLTPTEFVEIVEKIRSGDFEPDDDEDEEEPTEEEDTDPSEEDVEDKEEAEERALFDKTKVFWKELGISSYDDLANNADYKDKGFSEMFDSAKHAYYTEKSEIIHLVDSKVFASDIKKMSIDDVIDLANKVEAKAAELGAANPEKKDADEKKKERKDFCILNQGILKELGYKSFKEIRDLSDEEYAAVAEKVADFAKNDPEKTKELTRKVRKEFIAVYADILVDLGYDKPSTIKKMSQEEFKSLFEKASRIKANLASKKNESEPASSEPGKKAEQKDSGISEAEKAERTAFVLGNRELVLALGENAKSIVSIPQDKFEAIKEAVKLASEVEKSKVQVIHEVNAPTDIGMSESWTKQERFVYNNLDSVRAAADAWNSYSESVRRLMIVGRFDGFGDSAPRKAAQLMDLVGAGFIDNMPENIEMPQDNKDKIKNRELGKFASAEKVDGKESEQVMLVEFTPSELEDLVAYSFAGSDAEAHAYFDELNRAAYVWNHTPADVRRNYISGNYDADAVRNNEAFNAFQALTTLSKIGDNIPLIGNVEDVVRASKIKLIEKANELERKTRIDSFVEIQNADDIRLIQVSPERLREIVAAKAGRTELNNWDMNELYYAISGYNNLPDEYKKAALKGTLDTSDNEYLARQIEILRENGLIPAVESGSDSQPAAA